MRINAITKDQAARFVEWAEKWIAIGLSTEPADFDAATEAALKAYTLCNLNPPMVILRMGSPYGATLGGALAWAMLREIGRADKQVRSQVLSQVGDAVHNYRGGQLWLAGWCGYISFIRDVLGWKDPVLERFTIDEALAKSCGWVWWHENVLAISDRPTVVNRDDRQRLHCETGPSIAYRDGWALYYWHGVNVPADIIECPQSVTGARIDAEKNAEVRRVMIERYGAERYVIDSGAKVVDQLPDDYRLKGLRSARVLLKTVPDDEPIAYVDLLNSTPEPDGTTRRYMLRVDPNAYGGETSRNAHAAAASTWRNADGSLAYADWRDYAPMAES